jgi:ribose-phosphate pyrophosphokinase
VRPYRIFAGNSNPELAREICAYLGTDLGDAKVGRFSDGEIRVEINESVRGADVYVIQSTCAPVNEHLMELLIMLDALKRASAGSISAVIPYFGYARQDRKAAPRAPISARLVTDLHQRPPAPQRIITMELHAGRSRASSTARSTTSTARPVMLDYIEGARPERPVIVSPTRAASSGPAPTASASTPVSPSSTSAARPQRGRDHAHRRRRRDCDAILVDDMVDTAGTLCQGARALAELRRPPRLRPGDPLRALGPGHHAHLGEQHRTSSSPPTPSR